MPLDLSLVVPVLNEAESVDIFVEQVLRVFQPSQAAVRLEFVFVNDGSTDGTLDRLIDLQGRHERVRIVDLSRNFGKEAALTAGILTAQGQVVVPIDVDLQDPPEVILEMLEHWRRGSEVVLGHRINRDTDSWAKRRSAALFYALHNKIAAPALPDNVGDFRLMDRCVVEALRQLPEANRFMKGLFAWLGFRTSYVHYVRPERAAGVTKFSGWKLWNFAMEGITSFSTAPLRVWTYVGLMVAMLSVLYALFIFLRVLIYGVDVPGYASMMVAITFFSGVQLMGIGVIGEYLGRTYIESKRRPVYVVRRVYGAKD